MRKMQHIESKRFVEVIRLAITRNMWEFFITPEIYDKEGQVVDAVVVGFEIEQGPVDLKEIAPYVITQTENLQNVMPAPGWQWVD